MKSSRILSTAALAMLCISCGGPSTIANNPGVSPQTNASVQTAGAADSTGLSPLERRRLFWRPDHLTLQKGVKQMVKLFYHGERSLRIADDCTGRVALDQIGFARIKAYRVKIYDVLALHGGPFQCSVLAKTRGEPAFEAILHIDVSA